MKHNFKVNVKVFPLLEETIPAKKRYAFVYQITITNHGESNAQLLTRHWIIQDETGHIEEVVGKGVVGQQPHLAPGEGFEYASGSVIKTPTGTMKGSYGMISDSGEKFELEIPEFVLSKPYTLQ
ncbi:ApaG protein [uncultured Candidatus Thioglobus sp.]|nr:ApaG protein [uncultured Candidatus Thioglobus sp.]